MSSHIYFMVRVGNEVAPIAEFSRNAKVYQYFNRFAQYGEAMPLSFQRIDGACDEIRRDIESIKTCIERSQKSLDQISKFNNSIADKFSAMDDIMIYINEGKEDLKEAECALEFVRFLGQMMAAAKYADKSIDPEDYIYFGAECGYSINSNAVDD